MFSKTLFAAALTSLAVAAPLEQRQSGGAFTLITAHSGDPNVHLRSVVANGGRFFIGKETSTYCPEVQDLDCTKTGKDTSFVAQPNTLTRLGLNVIVPGGQETFVTADGQVGFSAAHVHSVPAGSVQDGFLYTPPTENTNGNLQFNDQSFTACPTGEVGAYQIYALSAPAFIRLDCTDVSLVAFDYSSPTPAWQYE